MLGTLETRNTHPLQRLELVFLEQRFEEVKSFTEQNSESLQKNCLQKSCTEKKNVKPMPYVCYINIHVYVYIYMCAKPPKKAFTVIGVWATCI